MGAHCTAVHHALFQHFDVSQAEIPLCEPRQQADARVLHATQLKLPSRLSDPNNDELTEEIGDRTTESQREKTNKNQTKNPNQHIFQAQPTSCTCDKNNRRIKCNDALCTVWLPSLHITFTIFLHHFATELQLKPHQKLTAREPCLAAADRRNLT